jgi:hypothetical protein
VTTQVGEHGPQFRLKQVAGQESSPGAAGTCS